MNIIYLILLIVIVLIVFFYYENNALTITKIRVKRNIKSSIKLVHLSDIHSKVYGKNNYKLINKIIKLKPDLIVITGDLINMDGKNIDEMLYLLNNLKRNAPVYYILGNHEHRLKNLNTLIDNIKKLGIKLLLDELDTINIKGNKINILGLDEDQESRNEYKKRKQGIYEYKDYSNLFNELGGKEGTKLVLSHYPENFSLIGDFSYKKYDFDLLLSGHAHGGQFRLPLVGGLYAPGQGFFPKYSSGLYNEGRKLIVSRGVGPSRFPLRLFNRPEIVLIKID